LASCSAARVSLPPSRVVETAEEALDFGVGCAADAAYFTSIYKYITTPSPRHGRVPCNIRTNPNGKNLADRCHIEASIERSCIEKKLERLLLLEHAPPWCCTSRLDPKMVMSV
jgi:hypothetical protein